MMQLHRDQDKFEKASTQILVVAPENQLSFNKYWNQHEYKFIGIPDPEGKVRSLYGQEFKILKLGTMPAQILIDKEGIVRLAHYGRSMADIIENKEVLTLLDKINKEQEQ